MLNDNDKQKILNLINFFEGLSVHKIEFDLFKYNVVMYKINKPNKDHLIRIDISKKETEIK